MDSPRQLPEALFTELATRWRREVAATSSISKVYFHPAYQQIIGLGPDVLPLIFRELRKKPELWFWALGAITGENPAPKDAVGDVERQAEAWLKWWEGKHGDAARS